MKNTTLRIMSPTQAVVLLSGTSFRLCEFTRRTQALRFRLDPSKECYLEVDSLKGLLQKANRFIADMPVCNVTCRACGGPREVFPSAMVGGSGYWLTWRCVVCGVWSQGVAQGDKDLSKVMDYMASIGCPSGRVVGVQRKMALARKAEQDKGHVTNRTPPKRKRKVS